MVFHCEVHGGTEEKNAINQMRVQGYSYIIL